MALSKHVIHYDAGSMALSKHVIHYGAGSMALSKHVIHYGSQSAVRIITLQPHPLLQK
jgi:hypothetical protein